MALSVFLPAGDEIEEASRGSGLWIQRSGFTWTPGMESPVKTKSVYMLSSGSCFSSRLHGRVADVSTGAVSHPVYRYGKGLYLGCRNEYALLEGITGVPVAGFCGER